MFLPSPPWPLGPSQQLCLGKQAHTHLSDDRTEAPGDQLGRASFPSMHLASPTPVATGADAQAALEHTHACTHVHTHTNAHMRVRTCTPVCTHAHPHARMRTHAHVCAPTRTVSHMHTRVHAHPALSAGPPWAERC